MGPAFLQALDGLGNERVGIDTDSHEHLVTLHGDGLARLDRAAATRVVGLAELHHVEHGTLHLAVVADDVALRVVEIHEVDALLLCLLDLVAACRHLVEGAAIDHRHVGAEALGRAAGVHGGVATTDHDDLLADIERRLRVGLVGVHDVDAEEELVGGEDMDGVLAGNVHKLRLACARGDVDALEALLAELVDGDGLAHEAVGVELHAQGAEHVELMVHDLVRQTILRDAVVEHAAEEMEGLEDVGLKALLGHLARKGKARGTGTDDGDLDAVGGSHVPRDLLDRLALVIGDEALQRADGDGGVLHLDVDTMALTLLLLRADAAADGGEGGVLFEHAVGSEDLAALDVLDEGRDVHVDGATLAAGGLGAVDAATGLVHGHLQREALGHLLDAVVGARVHVHHRHGVALEGHAILVLHRLAQLVAPGGATVGQLLDGVVLGTVAQRLLDGGLLLVGLLQARLLVEVDADLLQRVVLHLGVDGAARLYLLPIDLRAVEERTVDADEAGLAANGQAAAAADARAIDDDGVEGHIDGDGLLLADLADGFHHGAGTDDHDAIDLLAGQDLAQRIDGEALLTLAAVVGDDDELVAGLAHLIDDDQAVLRLGCHHAHDAVACLLHGAGHGEHADRAHTAADTDHRADLGNGVGGAERTDNVEDLIALGELAELGGREAGLLDHERQRPLLLVAIDDDEGDALAVDVGTHGDEVARTAAAGNLTILDDEAISVVGELFLG